MLFFAFENRSARLTFYDSVVSMMLVVDTDWNREMGELTYMLFMFPYKIDFILSASRGCTDSTTTLCV